MSGCGSVQQGQARAPGGAKLAHRCCLWQVPGWDLHCARLAQSLRLLSLEASRPLPEFSGWCQRGDLAALPRVLGGQVLPSVQAVVAVCRQARGCNSVLVVVLVCEASRQACKPGELARQRGCGPCARFLERRSDCWLRPGRGAFELPVDVFVYGSAHDGHSARPAKALVVGPGRRLPLAKDSRWVLDRAPLEQALVAAGEGPTEGLLCSSSGCLLEGLVTNLFVVAGAPRAACVSRHAPVPALQPVRMLMTATFHCRCRGWAHGGSHCCTL